jgi:pyruvate/2-oxoglutarate dehydrogenase complex dihydrolipoamide acyltransferase (E2) component
MAVPINIPKLGMTMKEAKITEWKAKEGDWVEKGNIVLAIETEKVSWEVEAVASGFLHVIMDVGQKAEVGAVVGYLAESEEELQKLQKESPPIAVEEGAPEIGTTTAAAASAATRKAKSPPASPLARRVAEELGVELSLVEGTGPGGRITKADVVKHHEAGPPPPVLEKAAESVTAIPFTGMRKSIAENMHASLLNTAQLTVFAEADVTEMVRFRELVREQHKNDESIQVSYTDIIILAVSRVLKRIPMMNSTLVGEQILLHHDVNVGIAVSVPEGLMVPVLRNAEKKGLLEISREAKELVQKARQGTLTVDEVTGGTFTITNVSMFEVDGVTPILRSPETGILGIGRIKDKPAVHNGEIRIRSMSFLSLTFDHRVLDGAGASDFLQTVTLYISHPSLIST